MDEKPKAWYSFLAPKQGAPDEWIELPIRATSPEGAAAVLRVLLDNRPSDTVNYRVEVRVDL